MTLTQGLLIALARSAAVAPAAALLARPVAAAMRGPGGRWLMLALLAVWLMPAVVVGYVYSDGPLSLARHPFWNELLYSSLLCAKALPIAVAAIHLAPPPPLSPQALFLRTLVPLDSSLRRRRWRHSVAFTLRGPWRSVLIAAAAAFLLTFSDFELASLMNAAAGRIHSAYSWTIWLHESHQLHYTSPAPLLGGALAAAACQGVVLAAGLWLILATRQKAVTMEHRPDRAVRRPSKEHHPVGMVLPRVVAAIAVLLIAIVPGFVVLRGAIQGIASLLKTFRFGDELAVSLLLAAMTAAAVTGAVWWLRGRSLILVLLCCLPGLLGAMVLAMLIFTATRWPALGSLSDTPLPMLLGLTLLLLPPAVLLRRLFDAAEPGAALHLAHLLRSSADAPQQRAGRRLLWRLRGLHWFWLAAFVFVAASFELVVAVSLMPPGMTPLIVSLYNQMHFGHRALLSAGVVVMLLVPVLVIALTFAVLRQRR